MKKIIKYLFGEVWRFFEAIMMLGLVLLILAVVVETIVEISINAPESWISNLLIVWILLSGFYGVFRCFFMLGNILVLKRKQKKHEKQGVVS